MAKHISATPPKVNSDSAFKMQLFTENFTSFKTLIMPTINRKANSKTSIAVIAIKLIPSLFLILALIKFHSPIMTLPLVAVNILVLMTLFRCHYTIVDNSVLILRFAFKKKVIHLESIYHISGEKSIGLYAWFNNWSNSLKCIEIRYGENSKLFISPENSEDFIAFLEKDIKNRGNS